MLTQGGGQRKIGQNRSFEVCFLSIYIRERYDFTKITIFGLIGVDSSPKLVAIIFTSAGNDVQKIEVSTLIFLSHRNARILGCVLKEF